MTAPAGTVGELQFDLSPDDQPIFLADVDEQLQRLESSLVDLERAPTDQALLNEIFRAAHTIKGNAATIGHARMAALTHAMETRLDGVRAGAAAVTPELIGALLVALDVLKVLRHEVETRIAVDVDVDAAATAVERRAERRKSASPKRRGPRTRGTAPQPAPEPATHRFTVALDDAPWVGVRALQALLALAEHGRVLFSDPSQAAIERQDDPGSTLIVLLASEQPDAVMLEALHAITDLGSVTLERLNGPHAVAEHSQLAPSTEPPVLISAARPTSTTIRIDVTRLDALLNLVGELVVDRTRLVQLNTVLIQQFGDQGVVSDLQQTSQHIGRIIDELQEQVMKSRMLSIDSVFSRLPRVVRDLAAKQGKQIEFIVEGKETELDRSVIEEIGDPLLHLIRNGVDHGIETPEDRLALGKPAAGTLRLSARHADSFIVIALEDDGNGINLEAVKRAAVERGVVTQEYAERMSEQESVHLIFAPGLSTAREVSDVSGRGVGMDVVRANVERINGSVEVETRAGQGTTFTIRLPLTLAIVQSLLVRVGGVIYALPIHSVTETMRVQASQIRRVNHREAIELRGAVLPLISLRHVFGLASDAPEIGSNGRLVVAVNSARARQVGLIVDGLVGEQEIVVKPLGQLVGDVAGVSGAAILGDGTVALILDVATLISRAIRDNTTMAFENVGTDAAPLNVQRTRDVVDTRPEEYVHAA